MKYKPLSLEDIETVSSFYPMAGFRTCDFTIGGMFMWRDFYKMEYAVEENTLYSRLQGHDGVTTYYNVPLSADADAAVDRLLCEQGTPVKFCTVPEGYLPVFRKYGDRVTVTEQTDFADYLYRASDLAQFAGKKYSGQRNQISQFKRSVDDWSFEPVDKTTVGEVRDFFSRTYLPHSDNGVYESEENRKVMEVLDNFEVYGLSGGCLRANGAIVGFSIHEVVGDTLFTHIEKADRQYKGAYQMLVHQAAAAFAADVAYINREEDMGDMGLRTSKSSYHPVELLKKYIVEVM